jgi:hypothetical protein
VGWPVSRGYQSKPCRPFSSQTCPGYLSTRVLPLLGSKIAVSWQIVARGVIWFHGFCGYHRTASHCAVPYPVIITFHSLSHRAFIYVRVYTFAMEINIEPDLPQDGGKTALGGRDGPFISNVARVASTAVILEVPVVSSLGPTA